MKDDLANRSLDIHWPAGFTPDDADLFSHNELLINAPCERVWRHIVEATKWPRWYPNSSSVEILGDGGSVLKDSTVFRLAPARMACGELFATLARARRRDLRTRSSF